MNTGGVKIDKRFVRFGAVGMSDIIGVWNDHQTVNGMWANRGRFIAIEVKSKAGTVTPAQQLFIDQVNSAGGKAFCARSVEDVRRELGL